MALFKETKLGKVSISDQVIAKIISDTMSDSEMNKMIWPSTLHGHQIGTLPEIVEPEFASNIETLVTEDNGVSVEFNVIVKFGISIKKVTKELADRIHDNMEYILGISPSVITVNIAGVKSKHIAKRNTRAVYRYGIE